MNPPEDDELRTLDADLRTALQHQRAEYERVLETQLEMARLIERARALLQKSESDDGDQG
jgi:hypothetical protein